MQILTLSRWTKRVLYALWLYIILLRFPFAVRISLMKNFMLLDRLFFFTRLLNWFISLANRLPSNNGAITPSKDNGIVNNAGHLMKGSYDWREVHCMLVFMVFFFMYAEGWIFLKNWNFKSSFCFINEFPEN